MRKSLLYVINVDWYFCLHWLARAKAAQQAGYTVHVATQITDDFHQKQLQSLGFNVHPITLSRKSMSLGNNVSTFRQLNTLIRELCPTLVHSITVKPNLFTGFICKRQGIPQILSITGLGLTFSSKASKARISRFIVTSLYRLSSRNRYRHRILFENGDDKALFEQEAIAPSHNMEVIAGAGVDLSEYHFSQRPHSKNDEQTILFAARMLWDKGLPVLLEATRQLKQQGYQFQLAVAGILDSDSQNAIPLKKISQWEQQGDIVWLGQVSDMVTMLQKADIVCLPTQYGEGVPRILIEAAAVGRPIVTTNVAGCRDIVSDNQTGFLVPIQNSQVLAEKLKVLLDNEDLRHQFGAEARRKVEQTFCQKIVIQKTLSAYEQVLGC